MPVNPLVDRMATDAQSVRQRRYIAYARINVFSNIHAAYNAHIGHHVKCGKAPGIAQAREAVFG